VILAEARRGTNPTPFNLWFAHGVGPGCWINDLRTRSGAAAYSNDALHEMIGWAGLRLARPLLKGAWLGATTKARQRRRCLPSRSR
jgi:hypothetical protein